MKEETRNLNDASRLLWMDPHCMIDEGKSEKKQRLSLVHTSSTISAEKNAICCKSQLARDWLCFINQILSPSAAGSKKTNTPTLDCFAH